MAVEKQRRGERSKRKSQREEEKDKCIYGCIFGFKGASTSKVIGARHELMMDDSDGQMIFGDLGGLKLPHICITGEENPEKPHPGNLSRPGIEPGPAA